MLEPTSLEELRVGLSGMLLNGGVMSRLSTPTVGSRDVGVAFESGPGLSSADGVLVVAGEAVALL